MSDLNDFAEILSKHTHNPGRRGRIRGLEGGRGWGVLAEDFSKSLKSLIKSFLGPKGPISGEKKIPQPKENKMSLA